MKRGSSVRLIGLPSGEVAGASKRSVIVVAPAYADAGAGAAVAPGSAIATAAARTAATMLW